MNTTRQSCLTAMLSPRGTPPVVKRLSNNVETKGLAKVTTLTMDDCTEMRQTYGRCSTLLHSSADALSPPLPKPEVVQIEITALRDWVTDIKER